MSKTTYFKVLGPDRMPIHGGHGQYPEVGVWTAEVADPALCERGYHVVTEAQLPEWLRVGCQVWEVALGRKRVHGDDKSVAGKVRLVRLTRFDWAEYDKVKAAAWADYNRVMAAAWADYDRVTAAALADYNKVEAAAWADDGVKAAAWADYDRVTAAAWADYNKVKAAALADYEKVEAAYLRSVLYD